MQTMQGLNRRFLAALVCLGGLMAQPGLAAAGAVRVALVEPARFADAGYSHRQATPAELAQLQQALQGALQPLAERGLPAGAQLQLQLLDVDLAGELELLRRPTGTETRVMREITWPRLSLRWRLEQDGRELRAGEQLLSDLNYLAHQPPGRSAERYEPERRLLQRWFQQTFGPAGEAP